MQILFKRSLSSKQWLSLCILTLGCMVHAAGSGTEASTGPPGQQTGPSMLQLGVGAVFILIQVRALMMGLFSNLTHICIRFSVLYLLVCTMSTSSRGRGRISTS